MPNYYKPITWKNRPTLGIINPKILVEKVEIEGTKAKITHKDGTVSYADLSMDNAVSHMEVMDRVIDRGVQEEPKRISYVCKNCNGHINPLTMKCEYCDTQY